MRDIAELREIYDREHRFGGEFSGRQREVLANLVRLTNKAEQDGFVIYSKLDETNADQVIREQVEYYTDLGCDFEWKLFSHDTPPDLKERLAKHGFEIDEDETIMVLEISDAPEKLTRPPAHDVRRVTELDQTKQVRALIEEVYGEDYAWLEEMLSGFLLKEPDNASIYMAYDQDRPIAAGWTFFNPPSPFAGLYGGATLEPYRGRGVYTALVAARLQEAQARGFRFLTVDAGPMSRPILENLGFQCIAISNPCNFKVNKPSGK